MCVSRPASGAFGGTRLFCLLGACPDANREGNAKKKEIEICFLRGKESTIESFIRKNSF